MASQLTAIQYAAYSVASGSDRGRATENVKTENAASSKIQGRKTRERKNQHQTAKVKNERKCVKSLMPKNLAY